MQGLVFFLLPILQDFVNPDREVKLFVNFEVPAGGNQILVEEYLDLVESEVLLLRMGDVDQLARDFERGGLHELQLPDHQRLPGQRDGKEQLLTAYCHVKPDLVVTREVGEPALL